MTKSGHLLDDPFSPIDREWVLDTLGLDFLSWVTTVPSGELERRMHNGEWLGEPVDEIVDTVIAEVLRQRHDLLNGPERPRGPVEPHLVRSLVRYSPELGMSSANAWRLAAGGAGPTSRHNGLVEHELETAAWHVWPAYLARTGGPPRQDAAPALRMNAVLPGDEELAPILHSEPGHSILLSHGRGATGFSPVRIATGLLNYGAEHARRRNRWPELYAFTDGVIEGLGLLRRLGAGEEVVLPATIAFTQITVPPGTYIQTAAGVLRIASDGDRHRTGADTGLVLETSLPLRLSTVTTEPGWDWRGVPGREKYQRARQRAADRVVLGFALALGWDAVPRPAWTHVSDPLSETWIAEMHEAILGADLEVAEKRMSDVEHWLQLIDQNAHAKLDIPIRRIVASVTERGDPQDALIDAVIAWDSLVGAAGETRLRVTTALTILLEDDTALRPELHKQLRAIYDLRSGIVHGSHHADEVRAARAHREALDVALRSIARILRDRPWLAELDSVARSKRLLLGTPSP